MAYEQKNGQITVWKNDKYEVGGNQPYARGKGKDHNGNDVDIALWIPKSDRVKGFNLTIKASEPIQQNAQAQAAPNTNEDDLPF